MSNTQLHSTRWGIIVSLLIIALFPAALSAQVSIAPDSTLVVSALHILDDPANAETVSTLPYAVPISVSDDLESSTITPALTPDAFGLTFTQNLGDTDAQTGAITYLNFIPSPGATYSIAGSQTATDGGNILNVELLDLTKSTILYNYGNSKLDTLTLDTTGGPLTGPLIAGDTYEFYINLGDSHDFTTAIQPAIPVAAEMTTSINAVFAVPEPASLTLLLPALTTLRRARVPSSSRPNGCLN